MPEHATASISGDRAEGTASVSQLPLGVANYATASGTAFTLDVPTATHASLRVHPTVEIGTEMLRAGVPAALTWGRTVALGWCAQLARASAPSARAATRPTVERAWRKWCLMILVMPAAGGNYWTERTAAPSTPNPSASCSSVITSGGRSRITLP